MPAEKTNKYFDFRFEDLQSSTSLKYALDRDKSIANVFFNRIQKFFETTPNLECGYTAASGLRYTKADLDFLLHKLRFYIHLLNKKSHVFDLKTIDDRLLNDVPELEINRTLNLLHEDFEQNMNDLQANYQKVSSIVEYRDEYLHLSEVLNTINNTIHEVEGAFYNYHNFKNNRSYAGFYSTCLLDRNGWTGERYHFCAEDYQEFSLEQFFGQLCIGYDITGKSLLQAYWTNDLKIVREHKITPQTSFSSNVLLYFKSHDLDCETVYDGFRQWYDRHDIAQYGYSKKISDESLGNITIGRLKYVNETEIDLDRLNLSDKLAIVDLIKNKTLKIYLPIIL